MRHNLGETLPHPTPLTWSVMRRFMTGAGGFGEMYRMAGFGSATDALDYVTRTYPRLKLQAKVHYLLEEIAAAG